MPELPEVETVRNTLKKQLLNKRIKDVKVLYSNMIENDINYFIKKNQLNKYILIFAYCLLFLFYESKKNVYNICYKE